MVSVVERPEDHEPSDEYDHPATLAEADYASDNHPLLAHITPRFLHSLYDFRPSIPNLSQNECMLSGPEQTGQPRHATGSYNCFKCFVLQTSHA